MGFFQPPKSPFPVRPAPGEPTPPTEQSGACLLALSQLQVLDLTACCLLTDNSIAQVCVCDCVYVCLSMYLFMCVCWLCVSLFIYIIYCVRVRACVRACVSLVAYSAGLFLLTSNDNPEMPMRS